MRHFVFLVLSTFLLTVHTVEGSTVSLVGSNDSQIKQNYKAEIDGLPVIRNDDELDSLKAEGKLVPIPEMVKIDPRLDTKWRWCLVQSTYFIGDVGLEFREIFNKRLQINSAVRTVLRQRELIPINGNAAPITGPKKSSHLTGATIDIAKIGLTKAELEWVRKKLLQLEEEDRVEATEENDQLVFHVMVFKNYSEQETH